MTPLGRHTPDVSKRAARITVWQPFFCARSLRRGARFGAFTSGMELLIRGS